MDWEELYFELSDIDPDDDHPKLEDLKFSGDGIHENIYSAAVGIRFYFSGENDVYRGHTNRGWDLIPTLYRDDVQSVSDEIKKMSSLVRFLQDDYGWTLEDALAIAKHYSEEAGVKSWLLDVTHDYEVACHFASTPNRDGDIGEIYLISELELSQFHSNTAFSTGELGLYTPRRVPRIERQEAAFIDRSHPDLLNGYVHWTVQFRQQDGLKFENPENDITEDYLFPDDDEFLNIFEEWKTDIDWREIPVSNIVTPPHRPTKSLTMNDYLTIAKSWLDEMGEPYETFNEQKRTYLHALCDLHAYCANNDFSEVPTSLHNLHRSIESYLVGSDDLLPFQSVASQYIIGAKESEKPLIRDKIAELGVD